MKCRKCGGRAALELRRHNTAYCADDYLAFFRHQVLETIRKWRMFPRDEPVLVAVSGGKDSLALWDVLLLDGYATTGLYIDLGIGDYSRDSRARCQAFAAEREARLLIVPVADLVGAGIPQAREATRRPACSACGLSKRYIMNRTALEHGFPVVATGHNLDDEAATLFGSTLRWDASALGRQSPVLPASHDKLVRRVKPLFRLSERETAAYAFLRGIDYIVEECPFSKGATSITHKEVLNRLEEASPGSKASFVASFLDRARSHFASQETVELVECTRCGQVTTGPVCAFCKLAEQVRRANPGASSAGGAGPDPPAGGDSPDSDPPALRGLASDAEAAAAIHAP